MTNSEELLAQALRVENRAKALVEQAKELKDQAKVALKDEGLMSKDTRAVGSVRTIIKEIRKYNPTKAKKYLSAEQVEEFSTMQLDKAKLEENFSPAEFKELFCDDVTYSLELRPLED